MSVSAYEHHELMEFLKERWGAEKARTMMNLLPVVGWADVATKADLHALGTTLSSADERLDGKMSSIEGRLNMKMTALEDRLDTKLSSMETRLTAQASNNLRMLFFGMLASNATFAGLVLAAVRLG